MIKIKKKLFTFADKKPFKPWFFTEESIHVGVGAMYITKRAFFNGLSEGLGIYNA